MLGGMFGGLFGGGGTGPVATGMSTSDLLKTGSDGNFAFQPNQQDNSEMMSGLLQNGANQVGRAMQPQMLGAPQKREYSPFPQQPGVFEMQNKPALPPDIMALVEALRGANGQ